MRSLMLSAVFALLFANSAFAIVKTELISVNEKNSPAYPVLNSTIKNQDAQGGTYFSVRSEVKPRPKLSGKPVYSNFAMHWTYGRGVGVVPSVCPNGYKDAFLGCNKNGKWVPKSCKAGSEKQLGLCYKRCATRFKGYGPICSGDLADLDVSEVSDQVKDQYNKALGNINKLGIKLQKDKMPRLKTDLKFNPTVCANKGVINLVGNQILPKLVSLTWGEIADKIAGKTKIKGSNGKTAWVIPGLSEYVLLDLSFGAKCSEDEQISKASINVDSAVTVKVSTKIFDSAFHNLGGVSIGVAKVSIYELIPFRLYGSVAAKVGTKVNYEATVHKDKKPAVYRGKAYAHNTVMSVTPQFKLWLGSQAYLRLPSLTSAIPDLMRVGVKSHLAIVDWSVPYRLQEGVANPGVNDKLQFKESIYSDTKSGYGHIRPFLSVIGININAFKKKHELNWKGYEGRKLLLNREAIYKL